MSVLQKEALFGLAIMILFAIAPADIASQTSNTSGAVRGSVVTLDSQGAACVPGAKVMLTGSQNFIAESNGEGNFYFPAVPSGKYSIAGECAGLEAEQTITVQAGGVTEVVL